MNKLPSNSFAVAPGVWGRKDVFVNYYIIQDSITNDWILLDAGLRWSAQKIRSLATAVAGQKPPKAIVLTHGHFDHVGAVRVLAEEWGVPVFAHPLEIPYLTGQSSYPPPDSTVGGGMMTSLAFLYPKSPINIWKHIKALPPDGSVPFLHEWKYIHTPGHSPGHVSLFRESDAVLLAGDAFVTTQQESLLSVFNQTRLVSGPPKYFTCDWFAAKRSLETLYALKPEIAATGHGMPMDGFELQSQLSELNNHFVDMAVPENGRYVPSPAITNANGVVYIPPKPQETRLALKAFGISALVTLGLMWTTYRRNSRKRYNETLLDVDYNF